MAEEYESYPKGFVDKDENGKRYVKPIPAEIKAELEKKYENLPEGLNRSYTPAEWSSFSIGIIFKNGFFHESL